MSTKRPGSRAKASSHTPRASAARLPPDLAQLMAELRDEENVVRTVFRAWLARRPAHRLVGRHRAEVRSDGRSLYAMNECVLTRLSGLAPEPDPRPVLVSDRRYQAGTSEICTRHVVVEELARRGISYVRVCAPYPSAYAYDAEELERGYLLQTRVRVMAERGEYPRLAGALVGAWLGGNMVCFHHAYRQSSACLNSVWEMGECLLTWSRDERVGLLSAKRYKRGTHRQLLHDALREELQHARIPMREVRPLHRTSALRQPEALRAAWAATGLRIVNGRSGEVRRR